MKETIALVLPKADRKAGMTLDHLKRFVRNAERAGFDGTAAVGAGVGWKGQLQRLVIEPTEASE